MNYIIELDVFFSPEDKKLSLHNDPENSVVLSNQANRLLLEMVTSKNEVLDRDYLVKRVWEDYGFTSSYNSLNVAVSEIRKAFSSLGKEPQIISTIPKVGFKFEGVVVPAVGGTQPLKTISVTEKKQSHHFHTKTNWIVFALIIILTLFLSTNIITDNKEQIRTKNEQKKLIYKDDRCNIYMLGHAIYNIADIKEDVEQEIKNCKIQKTDVFYEKTKGSALFIGACSLDDKGRYLQCITIKK